MFERALKAQPRSTRFLVNLGRVAAANGDHETAVGYFEQALTSVEAETPEAGSVRFHLGMSLRSLGQLELARELLDEAADSRGKTKITDPLVAEMRSLLVTAFSVSRMANTARENGQTGRAIALYRKALHIDPEHRVSLMNLASLLLQRGHLEEGLEHQQKVVELSPESATAKSLLARFYRRMGNIPGARSELEKALELAPTDTRIRTDYADLLFAAGEYDMALTQYQRVLELAPASERALVGRGRAHNRRTGCEGALGAFEEGYERLPSSHTLAHLLSRALLSCGPEETHTRALSLARSAFDEQPHPTYASTIAMIKAAEQDFPAAIDWQTKAVALAKEVGADALVSRYQSVLEERYQKGQVWFPNTPSEP